MNDANSYTILYINEKIISDKSELSYTHCKKLEGESYEDMIKREGLENVQYVYLGIIFPIYS